MNKYKTFMAIIFFLITILLFACASTDKNISSKEVEDRTNVASLSQGEQIKEIEVSEFILGVGDTIDISVYRYDELNKSIKIDPTGKIMFPIIGDIDVAGKGIYAFRDELKKKLSKYFIEPQVTVSISSIKSKKIMVLGEVKTPGVYTLDSRLSLLEAIMKAGSVTDEAKLSNVAVIRNINGKSKIMNIDLKGVFKEAQTSGNIILENEDIVYIPEIKISSASRFFSYISKVLSPFVSLGSGIVMWDQAANILSGKGSGSSSLAITP